MAIKHAPNAAIAATLEGNLGALLMSAGRLKEALALIKDSITHGNVVGEPVAENTAGALHSHVCMSISPPLMTLHATTPQNAARELTGG